MAVFNEVENGKKEKRFVWGKAFRARAEFAADGRPKILESGEEVNGEMVRQVGQVGNSKFEMRPYYAPNPLRGGAFSFAKASENASKALNV